MSYNDPYLKPGVICEVWDDSTVEKPANPIIARFVKVSSGGFNCFKMQIVKNLTVWDNYRVLETEWKFAPPDAVYSTVNKNGIIQLWSAPMSFHICNTANGVHGNTSRMKYIMCGICPDKSRYEGEAWKTSLRMRPKWAKVEK